MRNYGHKGGFMRALSTASLACAAMLALSSTVGCSQFGQLKAMKAFKAANLAEVARQAGSERVPPWFVVTEHACNEVLDFRGDGMGPVGGDGRQATSTLRQAIAEIAARPDLGSAQKSAQIRQLWDEAALPRELIAEVKRLRTAIREHRDSSGHDLCWHHPKLWGLLPERLKPEVAVPPWPKFLRGCLRYRESLERELPDAPPLDREFDEM